MALIVSSLDKAVHDRTAFDCGKPPLNEFLATRTARHQAQRVSRTFVLAAPAEPERILGYNSLSNCQIAREEPSEQETKALPRHPIPAAMLARLAVDQNQQGQRYRLWLLMDAIKRCALIGQQSDVHALVVDAKDDEAKRFYERYGFIAITDRPMTLYLPLHTGLKALRGRHASALRSAHPESEAQGRAAGPARTGRCLHPEVRLTQRVAPTRRRCQRTGLSQAVLAKRGGAREQNVSPWQRHGKMSNGSLLPEQGFIRPQRMRSAIGCPRAAISARRCPGVGGDQRSRSFLIGSRRS